MTPTPAVVAEAMKALDTDGDGEVSKAEWRAWYARSEKLIDGELRNAFDHFDPAHTGSIGQEQIVNKLHEIVAGDVKVMDSDVSASTREITGGEAKSISFDEFQKWMRNTPVVIERRRQTLWIQFPVWNLIIVVNLVFLRRKRKDGRWEDDSEERHGTLLSKRALVQSYALRALR